MALGDSTSAGADGPSRGRDHRRSGPAAGQRGTQSPPRGRLGADRCGRRRKFRRLDQQVRARRADAGSGRARQSGWRRTRWRGARRRRRRGTTGRGGPNPVGVPYVAVAMPCSNPAGRGNGALLLNPDSGGVHFVEQKDEIVFAGERGGVRHIYMDGRPHPTTGRRRGPDTPSDAATATFSSSKPSA